MMAKIAFWIFSALLIVLLPLAAFAGQTHNGLCRVELFVLGTAQDAGKPQIANHSDPAWRNESLQKFATSLAVIDNNDGARYLFDATPDIKFQLYALDQMSGKSGFRLDGIFITHAHIGHYLGLAQLGREAMGAKAIAVYVMPKMKHFLATNGPWSLLVKLGNIALKPLGENTPMVFGEHFSVTPFLVPHRGEYTETAGFKIQGPGKSAIYLPDIDAWEQWDDLGSRIEDIIAANDVLFLDATFFSGDELPGRDMSKIPHPTITHTMQRLQNLAPAQKAKIRFIHLNHSNPAHDQNSAAFAAIRNAGFFVAQKGEQHCLD